jgi:hypothetical protein
MKASCADVGGSPETGIFLFQAPAVSSSQEKRVSESSVSGRERRYRPRSPATMLIVSATMTVPNR